MDIEKRGYLNESFRIFHLNDIDLPEIKPHFHEFHKIVIFLSAGAGYIVEGKNFYPEIGDILLVHRHTVHQPRLIGGRPYERIVIWLNEYYINAHNTPDCNLFQCFDRTLGKDTVLIRPDTVAGEAMRLQMTALEACLGGTEYGSELMSRTYFLQWLISLNRLVNSRLGECGDRDIRYDRGIQEVLTYINANLGEELSVELIASHFYMSRYHLMHKFKEEVGDTLHHYVLQRRVMAVSEGMRMGMQVGEAALKYGFKDYSTCLRSFRRILGATPGEIKGIAIQEH